MEWQISLRNLDVSLSVAFQSRIVHFCCGFVGDEKHGVDDSSIKFMSQLSMYWHYSSVIPVS